MMFVLNKESLKNAQQFELMGIESLKYDYSKMIEASRKNPQWVHFGIGNIFRSFLAALQVSLLNQETSDCGIVAVETHDIEVLEKVYKPHDNLSLLVTLHPDGKQEKKVIGSISESLFGDPGHVEDWQRLKEIFRQPSLQMVSFTITEKGYSVKDLAGQYLPSVQQDLENGFAAPQSVMAKIAALLYERYQVGRLPIALVSMDNWARNGEKLQNALLCIVNGWIENKMIPSDFRSYIEDSGKVSFPWTMIDKITPRPSKTVGKMLLDLGLDGNEVICTQKDTHIAAFVNAEKAEYLVIEDTFPNGRIALEKVGVIFTDRKTVEKADKMKVCTCLNPLMTALAIWGCLLDYTLIANEMKNPYLNNLVREIGYREGMAVVVDPGVLNPKRFLDEAIEERLPNLFIPDTPQRIATDTSQKVIRFGSTIQAYMERADLDPAKLIYIPLTIAAWCRYLMGLNDQGQSFKMSTDPLLEKLQSYLIPVQFGDAASVKSHLRPILSNDALFGIDLYQVGLGEKIEAFFKELIAGPGAVEATLKKYVKI